MGLWQLNQQRGKDRIQFIKMGSRVPKIIHQTFHKEKFPPEISLNIKKVKELNPDWEYRFYNNKDIEIYIKKNFPEVLKFYLKINPKYGAARADLFRYLLIYKEGGVYFDIKSSFSKSLNTVIKPSDTMILSHWNQQVYNGWGIHPKIDDPKGEFQQCFIIATQGHPFLKSVIENILRNIETYNPYLHSVGRSGVLSLTGPITYTLAVTPLLHLHPNRLVQSDKDLGYIYSIYSLKKHKELFKTHYSKLNEPLVLAGAIRVKVFLILQRIKNFFF